MFELCIASVSGGYFLRDSDDHDRHENVPEGQGAAARERKEMKKEIC